MRWERVRERLRSVSWSRAPLGTKLKVGGVCCFSIVCLLVFLRPSTPQQAAADAQAAPVQPAPVQPGGAAPPDAPPVVTTAPVGEDFKKAAPILSASLGRTGDKVKSELTALLTSMEADRYHIRLTLKQEPEFLTDIHNLAEAVRYTRTFGVPETANRFGKLGEVATKFEEKIQIGDGPPKPVRYKLAEVEMYKATFGHPGAHSWLGPTQSDIFENQRAGVLHNMVRGRDPSAADVLMDVHVAALLATDLRLCQDGERKLHELLVLAYPDWKGEEVSEKFYGDSGRSREDCLKLRLEECSDHVVALYVPSKLFFDTYLSNSPQKRFSFVFPELTASERSRAEKLLDEARKKRSGAPAEVKDNPFRAK